MKNKLKTKPHKMWSKAEEVELLNEFCRNESDAKDDQSDTEFNQIGLCRNCKHSFWMRSSDPETKNCQSCSRKDSKIPYRI